LLIFEAKMKEIEPYIGILSGVLIFWSQVVYIQNTWAGKIRPNLLTWFGWSLLMGTSMFSQIWTEGWEWSQTGLALSTFGSLAIGLAAFLSKNYALHKSDWNYIVLGALCFALYFATKDPWLTTIFAIAADFIMGFPTLKKAFHDPASERTHGWTLGGLSWTFALLICFGHNWLYILFPLYLFIWNWGMVYLTRFKK
jgi:hypothetical protein